MWKSEIKPGEEYLLRESRRPDAAEHHVRVLEHVRGNKWKAKWIEPNAGLIDYVESKSLLVHWKHRKDFVKDEQSWRNLREHNVRHGYKEGSPITTALEEIFESAGEKELTFYRGVLEGSPQALDRVKKRAGTDPMENSLLTFVDRHGKIHAPFDQALELARAFCAAEPGTVLVGVEATERKWTRDATEPGNDHLVGLLNEYRAAWAIVRQWAGLDAIIAQRDAEIQLLHRLIWDAIYALQKAGADAEASRLRRAIERG
jgi:hypothetical protein